MVEQSRYVENVGSLMKDLAGAAAKLSEAGGKNAISPQEMKDLMKAINHVNANLDPTFWADKTLAPAAMNATIDKALMALALFQKVPPPPKNADVERAIISLFDSTLKTFEKKLRDLKKYKIGQKVQPVEKTGESKDPKSGG